MKDKIFQSEDAISNARFLWSDRYKGAEFCIASGSIITGKGTAYSDLDLIVVFPHLKTAYRESFTFNDMPVEVFVHDYETIQFFMDDDHKNYRESLPHMVSSGKVIPEENETSLKLRSFASALLQKRPESFDPAAHEPLRYSISDLIDDLRGERPPEEQRAILYSLYPMMGELALRHAGQFVSKGKHLARKLKVFCPTEFENLENIMHAAHCDAIKSDHMTQLENMVNALGGFLFDGYKQSAPTEKRSKPLWMEVELRKGARNDFQM